MDQERTSNGTCSDADDGSLGGGIDSLPLQAAIGIATELSDHLDDASPLPPQPDAVTVLTGLLKSEPKPEEMSIAILRPPSDGGVCDQDASYPGDAFKKVDEHLGLHALDLPRLAREFRMDYYALREPFRQMSTCEEHLPSRDHHKSTTDSTTKTPARRRKSHTSLSEMDMAGSDVDDDNSLTNVIAGTSSGTAVDSILLRKRIMDATSCLLLVCPDNATAWADRRRCLLFAEGDAKGHMSSRKVKSIFIAELRFLDLLFTHHSKAPNAWAHRKWICFRLVRDKISLNVRPTTEDQWYLLQPWAQREIDICTRVAEHFPNNYFAWAHRYYVISTLFNHWPNDGKKYLSDVSVAGSLRSFLAGEVMFIEQWLSRHVSDHAAAHYGTETLRLHLKHGFRSGAGVLRKKSGTAMEWALAVAEGILITSRHLIKRYSSHEVIWVWRRHVGQIFLDIMCGEFGAEKLMGTQAQDALNRFLQGHIFDVYDEITNEKGRKSKTKVELDKVELRRSRIHGFTYLLWLLDQLQRRETLIGLIQDRNQLNTVRDACKAILAKDDDLSYNTWRRKKVSEVPI